MEPERRAPVFREEGQRASDRREVLEMLKRLLTIIAGLALVAAIGAGYAAAQDYGKRKSKDHLKADAPVRTATS
jgi:hypothetical protein